MQGIKAYGKNYHKIAEFLGTRKAAGVREYIRNQQSKIKLGKEILGADLINSVKLLLV